MTTPPDAASVATHIATRRIALEGETRVNLLRLLGVATFYTLHLFNRGVVGMDAGRTLELPIGWTISVFDTTATAVAVAWAGLAGLVLLVVRTTLLRRSLGWFATIADLGLLMTLLVMGNGPSSAMLVAFYLLIAASGLRGDRVNVWLTTLGSVLAYGVLVWGALRLAPNLMPPNHHVLIVFASLTLMGVVMDSVLSAFWSMARDLGRVVQHVESVAGPGMVVPARGASCPWCGAQASVTGTHCSACEQPLEPGAPFRTGRPPSRWEFGSVHLGWAASVLCLVVLMSAIGVDLALVWPALLVPFGAVAMLVLVALIRLLQLDLRVDEDDTGFKRVTSTLGTITATLALGATVTLLLVALTIVLTAVAAVVLVALCFAVLAGSY